MKTIRAAYTADKYTYRVLWSDEDQEYVGCCSEFPSLSHLAATHEEALSGVIALVADVLVDMRAAKEEAPVPWLVKHAPGGLNE